MDGNALATQADAAPSTNLRRDKAARGEMESGDFMK